MENKVEPKLKYITNNNMHNMHNMYNINTRSNLKYDNGVSNSVDRSFNTSEKNSININNTLLNRQLTPATLYGSNIESQLRNPDDCSKNSRRYDINQVIGHNNDITCTDKTNNKSSINFDQSMNKQESKRLYDNYVQSCSTHKKDLNWGNYYTGGQIMSTRYANPENYHQTYLGIDTRLDNKQENPRNIDIGHRSVIPLEGFRRNYANVPLENDSRCGISTRTSKRVYTK
jgi:hypothetical protein